MTDADEELSILRNAWSVQSIAKDGCRRMVRAFCRKCKFRVFERYEHFVKREECPNCEAANTRSLTLLGGCKR
jgi:hypothetical protein